MFLPLWMTMALVLQSAGGPAPQPDRSIVAGQLSIFAQRMHDKQESAILSSYTRDAVFIDPSGKRFSTPAQLRALYDQVFDNFDSDLHFGPPAVRLHGSAFHASGTYTETLRNRKTGAVQQIQGTYDFTLRTYYDGHWSFSRMKWTMAH
jgi:ketosteroid isomerase-like protein